MHNIEGFFSAPTFVRILWDLQSNITKFTCKLHEIFDTCRKASWDFTRSYFAPLWISYKIHPLRSPLFLLSWVFIDFFVVFVVEEEKKNDNKARRTLDTNESTHRSRDEIVILSEDCCSFSGHWMGGELNDKLLCIWEALKYLLSYHIELWTFLLIFYTINPRLLFLCPITRVVYTFLLTFLIS